MYVLQKPVQFSDILWKNCLHTWIETGISEITGRLVWFTAWIQCISVRMISRELCCQPVQLESLLWLELWEEMALSKATMSESQVVVALHL